VCVSICQCVCVCCQSVCLLSICALVCMCWWVSHVICCEFVVVLVHEQIGVC